MPRRPSAQSRPRPVLTGRALVLGALLVALVVVLAAPVARFLSSRTAVASAAAQLQADRAARSQLRYEQAQYANPGYIEAQARSRLQFAMPGDTVYTVVRGGQRTSIEKTEAAARGSVTTGGAWTQRLWGSVEAAGR